MWVLYNTTRSLIAGSICGSLLLYSANFEAAAMDSQAAPAQPSKYNVLKHMQTLNVCGGSVRCLTWSKDSRLGYNNNDYDLVLMAATKNLCTYY